jgi:hypothetical protein
MNNIFTKKIRKLLKIIDKQRPGFIDTYGKELQSEEVHRIIANRHIPEGLTAFYSFINTSGVYSGLVGYIIPNWELIPIQNIKDTVKRLQDLKNKYPSLDWWKPDMIPFLTNGCGDYYCVRSLENDQSVYIIYHDDEPFREFLCLEEFLNFTIECYEKKIYFLDNEGCLDCNYDLLEKLRTSPSWKSHVG